MSMWHSTAGFFMEKFFAGFYPRTSLRQGWGVMGNGRGKGGNTEGRENGEDDRRTCGEKMIRRSENK